MDSILSNINFNNVNMNNFQNIQGIQSMFNFGKSEHNTEGLSKLSDSKVIQINNELNGIFNDQIKLPRLVVVGSQSSGKSSVLNSIITMNILPTGSEMVTRTPLSMELSPILNPNESSIEFGEYIVSEGSNNAWKKIKNIRVTYPEPTTNELNIVKNEIERITNMIAGTKKNISKKPINIKIFLPNVPNLTLIDLPGLTQVACRDKGQPDDIKDQIEQLVGSYIESEETIILSVIPARVDVEADYGVGFVRRYDYNFSRSVGVLTKVDIMNIDTDVSNYVKINSDLSKDLRMKYGYYMVRNRANKELTTMTMKDGFEKELSFFNSHPVYSKLNSDEKNRLGTENLRSKLVLILSEKVKQCLPDISRQINEKYNEVCGELMTMGSDIPDGIFEKQSYINHLVVNFCTKFVHTLEGSDKGNYNVGRIIKDGFNEYRKKISTINPINEMDPKYIENISKNVEGNHMSFFIPSIAVFESCLTDVKYKPIQRLAEPSINCIKDNNKILKKLVSDILNSSNNEIYRYPNLVKYLEDKIYEKIIDFHTEEVTNYTLNLINMEESYIWTENEKFTNNMSELTKGKMANVDINTIKTLLIKYYDTIKENIKNNVPKGIMLLLINKIKLNILSEIINSIDIKEAINMLDESDSVKIKRKDLIEWRNKLNVARARLTDRS